MLEQTRFLDTFKAEQILQGGPSVKSHHSERPEQTYGCKFTAESYKNDSTLWSAL